MIKSTLGSSKPTSYRVLGEGFDVTLISGVEKDGPLLRGVPVGVVDEDPLPEGPLGDETEVIDLEKNRNGKLFRQT